MTSSNDTFVRVNVSMAGFGIVRLAVSADSETGTSWYAVAAPRVTGTITVVHDPAGHVTLDEPGGHRTYRDLPPSPDTGRVSIDYAHRPAHTRSYSDGVDLDDHLVVNGITLAGGTAMNLDRLDDGRLTQHHIACRRFLNRYQTTSAPTATTERAALILTAVLTHWRLRPDGPALRQAAALAALPGYLAAAERRRADLTAKRAVLDERLAELAHDIASARALATPTTAAAA